jgi:hypothetical protein
LIVVAIVVVLGRATRYCCLVNRSYLLPNNAFQYNKNKKTIISSFSTPHKRSISGRPNNRCFGWLLYCLKGPNATMVNILMRLFCSIVVVVADEMMMVSFV